MSLTKKKKVYFVVCVSTSNSIIQSTASVSGTWKSFNLSHQPEDKNGKTDWHI